MTISPVILWTDALLWLLVLAGAVGAIKAYRHPPSRARWRKVAQRPLAMASATLLIVFLLIGLADSIHFRNREASGHLSVTVFSLLDVALSDLRNRTERTYSAPLALTSFSKETVQGADGRQTRVAPPLKWAGKHLGSAADQTRDLVILAVVGAAKGAAVWGGLAFLLVALLSRQQRAKPFVLWRRIWRDREGVAWWSVLTTLGAIALVAGPALEWGSHYHLLGTDKVGQDVLYQSLKAVRTALVIGCVTTLATIPLAIGMGLSAGFFRG